MRPVTPDEALLAGWLQRLVVLLLGAGGAVARQLERCVLDKQAGLQLDDACLVLGATCDSAGQLNVQIMPAEPGTTPPRRVSTSARALRDVLEGRVLLDSVVADGRVDLQAPLADLLGFHELVMHTLALAPRSPALRALWAEFDSTWPCQAPRGSVIAPPAPPEGLARQRPRHGPWVAAVPREVALARSPAASA